ncbi:hypothetical protein F2Q69_00005968 [Brassica cretica]|uniref:Uncharacterized protein n=1 Tax=Brassica cretica TaxID=69181 RepID=A0A8S9PK83_BRACR|nr:hypothetical protein F2Q69_00005968 [Brassica cretica]
MANELRTRLVAIWQPVRVIDRVSCRKKCSALAIGAVTVGITLPMFASFEGVFELPQAVDRFQWWCGGMMDLGSYCP